MMLTKEEKRQLLRQKLEHSSLPDYLANRYINHENTNQVDWNEFRKYMEAIINGKRKKFNS